MNFHILTLFPDMVMSGLNTSIIGRAVNAGLLSIEAVNIRDYAFNKHQSVDDYPYGGGAGMLMQAEPVYLAYRAVEEKILERCGQAEGTGQDGCPGSIRAAGNRGEETEVWSIYPLRAMCLLRKWLKNWRRKRI